MHAMPLYAITDFSDPHQVQLLHQDTIKNLHTSVSDMLEASGLTLFDILQEELRAEVASGKTIEWMDSGGAASLIQLAFRISSTSQVKKTICDIAGIILKQEMQQLSGSPAMRKPAKTLTADEVSNFSFDLLRNEIREAAPRLESLIETLSQSSQCNYSSTGYAGKCMNVSIPSDDDTDDETENELDAERGYGVEERRKQKIRVRMRRVQTIRATVIACLCYASRQRANRLQMQMGYYLSTANTPKRVMEVLHQLGIAVGYTSSNRAVKAVAKSCRERLEGMIWKYPGAFPSIDNINFYAHVRDQTQHNQSKLLNLTAGYIGWNPGSGIKEILRACDVDYRRVKDVETLDLLPNEREMSRHSNLMASEIYNVLVERCAEYLRKTDSKGKDLKPVRSWPQYQLPQQKTIVHTLPVLNRNEAVVTDMCKILRSISAMVGVDADTVRNRKILFKGDYLTARNMRYGPVNTKIN